MMQNSRAQEVAMIEHTLHDFFRIITGREKSQIMKTIRKKAYLVWSIFKVKNLSCSLEQLIIY